MRAEGMKNFEAQSRITPLKVAIEKIYKSKWGVGYCFGCLTYTINGFYPSIEIVIHFPPFEVAKRLANE